MTRTKSAAKAPPPADIELSVKVAVGEIIRGANAALAAHGLKIGALVDTRGKGESNGRYLVTQIEWGASRSPHLWFYGRKLRRNGTFGSHVHSLGGAADLRVVGTWAPDGS